MSDPQDWVTVTVTATIDPDDARKARYAVARAAIRRGWDSSAVRELTQALGLAEGRGQSVPSGSLFGCPSNNARTRHIREGSDCRKCWPGGRKPVAAQGDSA